MGRADIKQVKALPEGRKVDHYRASYGRSAGRLRSAVRVRRHHQRGAPTSATRTGNRRFWPVEGRGRSTSRLLRRGPRPALGRGGPPLQGGRAVVARRRGGDRRRPGAGCPPRRGRGGSRRILEWAEKQLGPFSLSDVLSGAVGVPLERQDRSAQMRGAPGAQGERLGAGPAGIGKWVYLKPEVGAGGAADRGVKGRSGRSRLVRRGRLVRGLVTEKPRRAKACTNLTNLVRTHMTHAHMHRGRKKDGWVGAGWCCRPADELARPRSSATRRGWLDKLQGRPDVRRAQRRHPGPDTRRPAAGRTSAAGRWSPRCRRPSERHGSQPRPPLRVGRAGAQPVTDSAGLRGQLRASPGCWPPGASAGRTDPKTDGQGGLVERRTRSRPSSGGSKGEGGPSPAGHVREAGDRGVARSAGSRPCRGPSGRGARAPGRGAGAGPGGRGGAAAGPDSPAAVRRHPRREAGRAALQLELAGAS